MPRVAAYLTQGGGRLFIPLALLLGYWALVATAIPRVGVTFDEVGHIVSGYASWKSGDYRLDAENGVLANLAASAPLLELDLRLPSRETNAWKQSVSLELGKEFLFRLGNPFEQILFRSRATLALFGVGLLWLVWCWTRRLFGATAAIIALVVGALSPSMLAHGGLVTSDMALACCLFAATSACWLLWHRITWLRLLDASAACGLAILAKMSGLLLLPMLAVLVCVRLSRPAPIVICLGAICRRRVREARLVAGTICLATAAVALATIAIVWAGYGFRYSSTPTVAPDLSFEIPWQVVLQEAPLAANLVEGQESRLFPSEQPVPAPNLTTRMIGFARTHRVLPEAYLWGLAATLRTTAGRPSFLLGKVSTPGSALFFPVTFLLKSTPVELLLFGAGVVAIFLWARKSRPGNTPLGQRRLYRLAPLAVLFFGYWLVMLSAHLHIGHRHLLPVYPVLFVVCGAAGLWLTRPVFRFGAMVGSLLLAWQAVDSTLVRPYYLSYFSPLAGGIGQGWHYLVDSSFDWGQGLPALAEWMNAKDKRGDSAPVFLSYFGGDSPAARGLKVTRFGDARYDSGYREFPAKARGGWFVISATQFQRVYLNLSGPWTAERQQLYLETFQSLPTELPANPSPAFRARWTMDANDFEVLQFCRLCSFLETRSPEAVVGGSLLVFRLTDAEVEFALTSPLDKFDAFLRDGRREIAK